MLYTNRHTSLWYLIEVVVNIAEAGKLLPHFILEGYSNEVWINLDKFVGV